MATERSITALMRKVEKALGRSLDARGMRLLGQYTVDLVRARTRDGFGVAKDGGRKRRLSPLSPAYIDFRSRFSGLSSETTPSTSNVTLTGEMLDEFQVTKVGPRAVRLGFGTAFAGKKANWTHDQGRPWANISGKEEKLIAQYVDNAISKSLKASRL